MPSPNSSWTCPVSMTIHAAAEFAVAENHVAGRSRGGRPTPRNTTNSTSDSGRATPGAETRGDAPTATSARPSARYVIDARSTRLHVPGVIGRRCDRSPDHIGYAENRHPDGSASTHASRHAACGLSFWNCSSSVEPLQRRGRRLALLDRLRHRIEITGADFALMLHRGEALDRPRRIPLPAIRRTRSSDCARSRAPD